MADQSGKKTSEFQSSVDRLEEVVQELVFAAKNQLSGRATAFVEETTARLRSEIDSYEDKNTEVNVSEDSSHRLQGQRLHRPRHTRKRRHRRVRSGIERSRQVMRSRHLYRDTRNEKIVGVCAGLAKYYGVETWVARCIAITGMIFMPTVTFPAYWVAYFILDKEPTGEEKMSKRQKRRQEKAEKKESQPTQYVSPAPELGPQLSPRRGLRNTQADFDELELRLRRMESHVTSGQYELQRELNIIDIDSSANPS